MVCNTFRFSLLEYLLPQHSSWYSDSAVLILNVFCFHFIFRLNIILYYRILFGRISITSYQIFNNSSFPSFITHPHPAANESILTNCFSSEEMKICMKGGKNHIFILANYHLWFGIFFIYAKSTSASAPTPSDAVILHLIISLNNRWMN